MFARIENDITYKGKKFKVGSYTIAQTIAFKGRIRKAEHENNEAEAIDLLAEMICAGVISPKIDKKKFIESSTSMDDLYGLCEAVTVGNGFVKKTDASGKGKKGKKQTS